MRNKIEKCYNIVDREARSGGLWGLRPLDMSEVVVMIIILIGNSVLKRLFIILKWNPLHLQSHAGRVVMSLGNRSIDNLKIRGFKLRNMQARSIIFSFTDYRLLCTVAKQRLSHTVNQSFDRINWWTRHTPLALY